MYCLTTLTIFSSSFFLYFSSSVVTSLFFIHAYDAKDLPTLSLSLSFFWSLLFDVNFVLLVFFTLFMLPTRLHSKVTKKRLTSFSASSLLFSRPLKVTLIAIAKLPLPLVYSLSLSHTLPLIYSILFSPYLSLSFSLSWPSSLPWVLKSGQAEMDNQWTTRFRLQFKNAAVVLLVIPS